MCILRMLEKNAFKMELSLLLQSVLLFSLETLTCYRKHISKVNQSTLNFLFFCQTRCNGTHRHATTQIIKNKQFPNNAGCL